MGKIRADRMGLKDGDNVLMICMGKGGRTIKEIGTQARREMEDFLGCKVSLHLWVKIKERWRDSDFLIKNYGFDKKDLEL